ncbi:hypothetical protein F511_40642 [Dorcoceras hygrometricum]|uniref:Uncharacterized protein n=1 Tax=Dorcoceras hygrometricum TaxID=472368 RepID=A0A2Z7B462_9LAMI|nr:hypothetical protein F511_40642 [Dorcoceras hygrometricum]
MHDLISAIDSSILSVDCVEWLNILQQIVQQLFAQLLSISLNLPTFHQQWVYADATRIHGPAHIIEGGMYAGNLSTPLTIFKRQSGPRPDPRLLRQTALEVLTRSARTDSPRKTRPEQIPAKLAAAAHGGGGGGGEREGEGGG